MEHSAATWTELDAAGPAVLLVPVGSCEQHGPHLPLDTDTRIACAVAHRVSEGRQDRSVAPTVAFGSSGEHQDFAGTLSIGTPALIEVLVELGRSALPADGAGALRGVLFVNGHGGNVAALTTACARLAAEGRRVHAWWPHATVLGGEADAHAGRTETSLMLAIDPSSVRAERPVGATRPIDELIEVLRDGGVAAVSPNGVLGDATGASAAEGERLLDALVADLELAIESFAAG